MVTGNIKIRDVMLTGATGFVGRSIVRALLARGLRPVCVVRSASKLLAQHRDVDPERLVPVVGSLNDPSALREAAELSQAAIHLVGIIISRRLQGRTFHRVHVRGTQAVVDAVRTSGIRRLIHMSALGARPNAESRYHRTKWSAEEYVRDSGLAWTIFRPSLIHGPEGEFMRLIRAFVCGLVPPVIPYFGSGQAKIQPVAVQDVAHCFVESLLRADTQGQVFALGGPRAYTWLQLYDICRELMPKAKRWKQCVSLPVPLAKMMAMLSAAPMALAELAAPSLGKFRFDTGQVQMSQKDSICDHTVVEQAFDIRMRSFEDELAAYADRIG
ncbi:MAG: NAD(P)H-binding protein [Planctomycetes bacterium]|nr:NAD(P)H-binding protein [Planctomycetota bacterium]